MTAKEYFHRIDELNDMIPTKMRQIASLRDALGIAVPPTDAEHVSHTRNVHAMEDVVTALVDAEREVNALLDELVDLKNRMVHVIGQLADHKEVTLLTERYIAGKAIVAIATESGYSRRRVEQLIKRATEHVDVILERA